MLLSVVYSTLENKRYIRVSDRYNGFAPPETRLPMTMVGGISMMVGLFWFAWTNGPEVPWIVSVIGTAPFGFGMVLVYLGIISYLIDSYTIYAASVLAGNAVLRSLFGAVFPLFTTYASIPVPARMSPRLTAVIPDVRLPRHSLGVIDSSLPRSSLRASTLLLLQVWSSHQNSVQVRRTVGGAYETDAR